MCLYFVGGKLYWEYAIRIETTFDTNTIICQWMSPNCSFLLSIHNLERAWNTALQFYYIYLYTEIGQDYLFHVYSTAYTEELHCSTKDYIVFSEYPPLMYYALTI